MPESVTLWIECNREWGLKREGVGWGNEICFPTLYIPVFSTLWCLGNWARATFETCVEIKRVFRSRQMGSLSADSLVKKIKTGVARVTRCLRMRPFGLKWKRLREWFLCLQEAGNSLTLPLVWTMTVMAVKSLRGGKERRWRKRMKTCIACEVYEPELKRCGIADSGFGCGCYMPYKCIAGTCWKRELGSKTGWSD